MNPKTGEVATIDPHAKPEGIDVKTEVQKTPQFLAREEIARRRMADRAVEDTEFKPDVMDDDGNIAPAQEVAAPKQEAEKLELAEEQKQEPEQKEAADKVATELEEERELIVDGKRIKVPVSKIIDAGVRTLQKETAADMKLAAASELERQLRERAQNFQPPQQQQQGAERAQPEQREAVQPSQEDANLAHAIQFGTEDEARLAIAALRNAGRGNPQDVIAMVRSEAQKMVQTALPEHINFNAANAAIRAEHKEIFADPDLESYFMMQETKARNSGDRRPYAELYRDIAEKMTTKFNLAKPEKAEKSEPILQERITRKREAPKIVQGAAGVKGAQPERKQMSVGEYVQAQRQRRGLQPLEKQGI